MSPRGKGNANESPHLHDHRRVSGAGRLHRIARARSGCERRAVRVSATVREPEPDRISRAVGDPDTGTESLGRCDAEPLADTGADYPADRGE